MWLQQQQQQKRVFLQTHKKKSLLSEVGFELTPTLEQNFFSSQKNCRNSGKREKLGNFLLIRGLLHKAAAFSPTMSAAIEI